MSGVLRPLALLLIAAVVAIPIFFRARHLSRRSPRARGVLAAIAIAGLAAGAYVAFELPHRVPDTPGSPAALVGILILWAAGGLAMFLCAPLLLGALFGGAPRAAR